MASVLLSWRPQKRNEPRKFMEESPGNVEEIELALLSVQHGHHCRLAKAPDLPEMQGR